MATTPPNTPPPYPPPQPGMDPRDYARAQKEYYRAWKQQQKDYWRANRDQWKAQRDQYRAQRSYWFPRRRSFVGPIILIAIGIIFLLVETGHMESWSAFAWFGRWWPAVLIAAGIARLVEWSMDRDQPYPPRSGGFGGLLTLIIIVGIVATCVNQSNMHGFNFGDHFNFNDNDTDLSFFHGPEHDYTGQTDATIPAGNRIEIVSTARGDVSVATGDAGKLAIETRKKVYTSDEGKAQRDADAFAPVITTAGNVTTVRLNGTDDIHGDMQVTLPADSPVIVTMQHGDLAIAGLHAAVDATTHHGDIRLTDVTGTATTRMDHGDLTITDLHGDAVLNGTFGDINVSNVSGKLTMDGDFPGDLNLRTIDGPLHFHSSRTDLDIARIVDQLTIDDGDIHGSNLVGPFRLKTRDFNIDLNNVSGDITVANSDGEVNVVAARPLGAIQIDNHSSGIRVTLPQNAGFSVNMEAKDGDINDDFGICRFTSEGDHKLCNGTVGNGGPKIILKSNEGDISIRRGGDAVLLPPAAPAQTKPPTPPAAPRKLSMKPEPPKAPAPPDAGIVQQ